MPATAQTMEALAAGAAAVEPPERRVQIVSAAYALLDEAGLEGLTIRAVLTRTGLARRAFYDCFAGKDDLVLAVFADTLDFAAARLAEQLTAFPDPLARLCHVVRSIVLGQTGPDLPEPSGGRRGAALSREHLRLAESRPADLQKAIGPLIDLIAVQIAAGIAAGLVRAAPVQRLAVLVYNLVSTTVHAELLACESSPTDPQQLAALADEIWTFCNRAIAASPP